MAPIFPEAFDREHQRAEEALAERTRLARLATEVGVALTRDAPLREILQQCTAALVRHLDAAFTRIWVLNDAEHMLELYASAGLYTHLDGAHSRVPVGAFKIGLIAQERRPHLTNAVLGDPRVHDQAWAAREGMIAFAGHPLMVADRVVGVMALFARIPLGDATLEALAAVADQIALGIERARAEAALQASEAHYRRLFDANPLPMWVIDRDTLQYLAVNEAAIQDYGYTRDEFLTMSVRDIRPLEDVPAMLEAFARPAATAGQTRGMWRHRLRDGRLIEVDITAYDVLFADRPARLTVARDITERQQAEARVQQHLARLALLHQITRAIGERQELDSIFRVVLRYLEQDLPLAFACLCLGSLGSDTVTVTAVGPAGQALAPTVGLAERAVVSLDQMGWRVCVAGHTVSVLDTTREPSPLLQRLARAGLRSLIATPLLVEDSIYGLLLAARCEPQGFSSGEDEFLRQLCEHVALAAHQASLYTRLQQAYEGLHQSQQLVMQQERLRALGQMASGIAHDINNAISPITLYVESLLASDTTLSARAREYLSTVQQAANDVAHTVARLRGFYRQPGGPQAALPVDLNQTVSQAVELTRARWRDEPQRLGITITVHTALQAEGLPAILGVESELREALINLIFNAVDAMPHGGRLTLRTRATPTAVVVEVSDTGIGIDEETRQRCLEPFYTTKDTRGTGLGLAVVYGVTERHAAQLSIESAVGQGTTVRLLFPRAPGQGETQLIHPDDLPGLQDTLPHFLSAPGATTHLEYRALHKDGAFRTLEVVGNNLLLNPAVAGIVINARDITERQEAARLKDDLLAVVSHELRTPLTSLRGFAELLLTRVLPADKQQHFLTIIHDETIRLSHLITDFLDLQRMQAGRQVYQLTRTDLAVMLREMVSVFTPESGAHVMRVEVSDALPVVYADAERLRQVLANLLSNAIKFSPHGGEVTVGARARKIRRYWSG